MNRELSEDRSNNVEVEDGAEGTLLRKFVYGLLEAETVSSDLNDSRRDE